MAEFPVCRWAGTVPLVHVERRDLAESLGTRVVMPSEAGPVRSVSGRSHSHMAVLSLTVFAVPHRRRHRKTGERSCPKTEPALGAV